MKELKKFPLYNLNSSVLDLGCIGGTLKDNVESNFHSYLRKHYLNVTGLDLNKKLINELNLKKGYSIIEGDVQDFNLHRKFDIIYAGNIIEHLTNLDGFFNSIMIHMNKDSRLIIFTPNTYSLINVLGILFKGKRVICHEHVSWHSLETLNQLFTRFGLKINKVGFFNSPINGGLLNIGSLILTKLVSFFRKAFSDTVIVECIKK